MRLQELLKSAGIPAGLADAEVSSLCHDSRLMTPGAMFFAIPGATHDGSTFISDAIAKGAAAVVTSSPPSPCLCPLVVVSDVRSAMADISAAFYNHPDRSLKCIGVTGTNGKTTTTFLACHILESTSQRCGLVGTVKYVVAGVERPAPNTTPESLDLQEILAEIRDTGGRAAAIEVSSHALVQQRVRGIEFNAAVFTNLTQDHLDFHGTMGAYYDAKASLFESLCKQSSKRGRPIINSDDRYGLRLIEQFSKKTKITTFGRNVHADYRAASIRTEAKGTTFALETRGKSYLVRLPLIGLFNVYNALGAIAAAVACGVEVRAAVDAIAKSPQVPGRLERVPCKRNFQVFVDYAHTDDALRNVLSTLRDLNPARIITVFGCGGDRDRTKRPLMAMAAEELSTHVILTSDNPRSEDPERILDEIETGLRRKNHARITDREAAIRHAVEIAGPGDIVLIAGKGHEKSQDFEGVKIPFDDVDAAQRAIIDKKGSLIDG
jgi:UDP-N-acetylmuramoyl-L-alanyl-D-glutamate--2,6-diaminopimelate ligase